MSADRWSARRALLLVACVSVAAWAVILLLLGAAFRALG